MWVVMAGEQKRGPMGVSPREATIFGHRVLGYVSDGDVELPADMIPYKSTEEHLLGLVEVEGFRPGAGTRILGKIPSGEWVIRASDKGDPIMLVDPSKCKPSFREPDLDWVQFETASEK